MQTGENEQALRKIIDFTRFLSLLILGIHIYLTCYAAFAAWKLTAPVVNKVLATFARMPVFQSIWLAKFTVLLLLLVSLLGTRGKKDASIKRRRIVFNIVFGLIIFFWNNYLLRWTGRQEVMAAIYIVSCFTGYLLCMTGGAMIARLMKNMLTNDIFNRDNETFPQEERLLQNEYSVNLPAIYRLKQNERESYINIINPFRGTMVLGTPGAGKSYFVIRHIITQHILKGFSMFIYDFKYDDLTRIAYNTLRQHSDAYPVKPALFTINFDDLSKTHRCNPLEPSEMQDITDAMESSRTFMLGLNREWIKKQGDFFVESPINFVTALIWFLKKYKGGTYCTLPHVIELAQLEYNTLFGVLQTEPEIEVLINPFVSAWKNEAFDQLEGQIASAKISMARLVSPALYYVLSGNDFTLDLNNPKAPKIICMGNNPLKQQVYGAVLSLYISRMIKLVNQKGRLKSSLIFDEFPTIYFNNIDGLIATARSNKVSTTLAVQDYSQLKKDYGREQAEVIFSIVGNVISGQVSGETAKNLSDRFGKIVQDRQSTTINSQDVSVNRSTQLDAAIPASKIATLSSGEFVGVVADDPDTPISLKVFHNNIQNDHAKIKREEEGYHEMPVINQVTDVMVSEIYNAVKRDIAQIVASFNE